MIHAFEDHAPSLHPDSYVAPGADLVGRVELGAFASVWFGCTLRADNDRIRVGECIHVDPGFDVDIAGHVTVGHRVVLHGCHIDHHVLIGINSVVLNGARIGPYCLVGANTMITSGKKIPERSMVIGSPSSTSAIVPPT